MTHAGNEPSTINIWSGQHGQPCVRMSIYPGAQGRHGDTCWIVCPGGSYFWLGLKGEGHDVAGWLSTGLGVTACVLRYRVGGIPAFVTRHRIVTRGNRWPDMLLDVQRAIELMRAQGYRRVGVMGFSAGGHLALMAATMFDCGEFERTLGRKPEHPLRPDYIAPIYPVVSLTADFAHGRSRRGLIGDTLTGNDGLRQRLSAENLIRPDMPPVFTIHCSDDPVVDYRNSLMLDDVLTQNKIPHHFRLYAVGGHGFGISTATGIPQWRDEFAGWINSIENTNHTS